MSSPVIKVGGRRSSSNRLGLDYRAEANRLPSHPWSIIDVHSHIGGADAAKLYRQVSELYGIGLTYSMTHLEEVEGVRSVLGDRIRFIAVPNYRGEDRRYNFSTGYLERIEAFHAAGARLVKFWAAPRAIDYAAAIGDPSFLHLDAPHTIEAMELASKLGMYFMTHVADPDTWFKTRYGDPAVYGTKREQYEPLEMLLDRFTQPWIAAHFGGWPEDLDFLTGLLQRHPNLYLDTSATKWMVRELSRHPRSAVVDFLQAFQGRVLFGSDIVVVEGHLSETENDEPAAAASTPGEAFDLYASRYWALRTLFESRYVGPSPIVDPDLEMVDPDRYGKDDAPALIGKELPTDLLESLYCGAAKALLDPLFQ